MSDDIRFEDWARFEEILIAAYDFPSGQTELDLVTRPLGFGVWSKLGGASSTITEMVHRLCELVEEETDKRPACIEAFYLALAGNADLRAWVQACRPQSAALVSDALFERERPLYAERLRMRQQQAIAASGFDALRDASGQTRVAGEIDRFRDRLTEATEQLQRLNRYKQLHDNLHVIQTQVFSELSLLLLKDGLDDRDRGEVAGLGGVLQRQAETARIDIEWFTDEAVRAQEESWLSELDPIVETLGRRGVDRETLRSAARDLRGILRMQHARLNRLLGIAARAIPFADLSELMRRVAAAAGGDVSGRLEEAAKALDDIAARLERLVSAHNSWQDIDTALWGIDAEIRPGEAPVSPARLGPIWQRVVDRLALVEPLDPGALDSLRADAAAFQRALDAPEADPRGLLDSFRRFASESRLQFLAVDRTLRKECAAVARLEPTLRALVEGDR